MAAKSKTNRRLTRRRLRKPLAILVGGVLLLVLATNLAVRFLGGSSPSPLSFRYLPEKLEALALLAKHGLVADEQPDPAKAVLAAAARHGLPGRFALAVARAESGLQPIRISSTGAMGLMQLMPGTARDLDVADPFDAADNADGGVRYLKKLWRRYKGDLRRVAAAYNRGPGNVPIRGRLRLPAATQAYVDRIVSYMRPDAPRRGGSKSSSPRRSSRVARGKVH